MIYIFILDTSASMMARVIGPPWPPDHSSPPTMTGLDAAKMAAEELAKKVHKTNMDWSRNVWPTMTLQQRNQAASLGLWPVVDRFVLLTTTMTASRTTTTNPQDGAAAAAAATAAAGGRLLVGLPPYEATPEALVAHFELSMRELKNVPGDQDDNDHHHTARSNNSTTNTTTTTEANGLNVALSYALQLLHRHRLLHASTEHFGQGRLPHPAMAWTGGGGGAAGTNGGAGAGGPNVAATTTTTTVAARQCLQPGVIMVLTNGECLKTSDTGVQLSLGTVPLKDWYQEPFRWDHRVFCVHVDNSINSPGETTRPTTIHPQLRALCDVTGGSYWKLPPAAFSTQWTTTWIDSVFKRICPPVPSELPLAEKGLPGAVAAASGNSSDATVPSVPPSALFQVPPGSVFCQGGPIITLQSLEADESTGKAASKHRCMLLYVGSRAVLAMSSDNNTNNTVISPPQWILPESFYPSKKLDTLPPRLAQPLLIFSKHPSQLGSKSFDALVLLRQLQRLDSLTRALRSAVLARDVYVCEWLVPETGQAVTVQVGGSQREYFPLMVAGAGRPNLGGDEVEHYLNVGVLHIPVMGSSTLAAGAGVSRLATITLLPPDPHILMPLLLKAAELEHRLVKKSAEKGGGNGSHKSLGAATNKANVPLDENWRSEFRAYLFRIPPYYLPALKRTLKQMLPPSTHSLLLSEASNESIAMQCYSKNCHLKLKQGEQLAHDYNERMEKQEASLKHERPPQTAPPSLSTATAGSDNKPQPSLLRYGQYDPRGGVDAYLASCRNMPPPWKGKKEDASANTVELRSDTASNIGDIGLDAGNGGLEDKMTALDLIGDLPASCMMAYYETRRRWIFGGSGLTCRGIHVNGVQNDGSNSQRCKGTPQDHDKEDDGILTLAGVGASMMNETSVASMGDYRERLLFSHSPVVGTGDNGVAATTAADGSPRWSVDDDAMPMAFFDPHTGEFTDSLQARMRSKLMVNFGNPYKEKRADVLVPDKWATQVPSTRKRNSLAPGSPHTPQSSPPHEAFDSVEEGEALFVRTSPSRTSPQRDECETADAADPPSLKRTRSDLEDSTLAEMQAESQESVAVITDDGPTSDARAVRSALRKAPLPPPPPPIKASAQRKVPPPPVQSAVAAPEPALSAKTSTPSPSAKTKTKAGNALADVARAKKHASPGNPKPSATSTKSLPPKPTAPPPKPSGPPLPALPSKSALPPPPPATARTTPVSAIDGDALAEVGQHRGSSMESASDNDTTEVPASAPTGGGHLRLQSSLTSSDLQRADVKPQVELPPGWISVWSKSQKRWYFFNTKNNQSVWEWPPPSAS